METTFSTKQVIIILGSILLFIAMIEGGCVAYYHNFTSAGYTQESLPGTQGTSWVKTTNNFNK